MLTTKHSNSKLGYFDSYSSSLTKIENRSKILNSILFVNQYCTICIAI